MCGVVVTEPKSQRREENHGSSSWLLLVLICVCFAGRAYLLSGLVSAKHTISVYFGTSEEELDLLWSSTFLIAFLSSVVIAAVGQRTSLRNLSIAATGFLFVGVSAATVGSMERTTYWLIIVSFLTTGVSSGLFFLIPTLLTDLWFSSSLNPLAFGLSLASMYVGVAASELTFQPYENLTVTDLTTGNQIVGGYLVRRHFVGGFGVVSLLSFASVVLVCVCMEERILSPTDEFVILNSGDAEERDCCGWNCLKRFARPLFQWNKVLTMTANSLLAPLHLYALYRMQEVLEASFPEKEDLIPYIYISVVISGVVGSSLAVFALMRYGAYKLTSLTGSVATALATIGTYISYEFEVFIAVVLCQIVMVIFGAFSMVVLLELLLHCDKQYDKTIVLSWHFGIFLLSVFFCDITQKYLVFDRNYSPFVLIIAASAIAIPCLILFVQPYVEHESPEADPVIEMTAPITEETRLVGGGTNGPR